MTAQKLKILLFGTSAEPSSVCWNCTLKSQSPSVLATNIERKYTNYLYVTHCNIYVCSCVSTKVFKMTSMMQFAVVQPVHATIDGARAALEYTESNAVNTSRVLLLPGDHSGFETIQNHLATLSPELAITATPSTSSDVAQAMWADTDRNTELAECGRKLTCQELVQLIDKIGELIVALDIPVYAAPAVVAPCSAD